VRGLKQRPTISKARVEIRRRIKAQARTPAVTVRRLQACHLTRAQVSALLHRSALAAELPELSRLSELYTRSRPARTGCAPCIRAAQLARDNILSSAAARLAQLTPERQGQIRALICP